MKISQSKNVAGYVRAVWHASSVQSRLDDRMRLLAPLRERAERAKVTRDARRGKLTGRQYAEAQRILNEHPTRRAFWEARERSRAASAAASRG